MTAAELCFGFGLFEDLGVGRAVVRALSFVIAAKGGWPHKGGMPTLPDEDASLQIAVTRREFFAGFVRRVRDD